jgi:hypothetical protein
MRGTVRWLCLGAALGVAGCSLALDTDRFRGHVASPDGGGLDGGDLDGGDPDGGAPDGGVPLRVTAVAPERLLEGLGVGEGVRPTALLITGQGLEVDEVTSEDLVIRGFEAGPGGTHLAVAVAVPEDETLAAGARRFAQVTLRRGATSVTAQVELEGLDALRLRDGDPLPTGARPPRYSRIVVEGGRLTGPLEGRLWATAGIDVQGVLTLNGQTDGAPGPGGCRGGGAGEDAVCGARGGGAGQPGLPASGGGGAANRSAGQPGQGGGGAAPGAPGAAISGHVMTDGLRAFSGQGGGGGASATSAGGGGGGGALALITRGTLTFTQLSARGGPGGLLDPGQPADCTRSGGGGGSGGALLLSAWSLAGGAVDVGGGTGTRVPACGNHGGDGGDGFVFVQAPLQTWTTTTAAVIGPTWRADTPVWVRTGTVALGFTGVAGRDYFIAAGDRPARLVSTPAGGLARADVYVGPPGVTEICLMTTDSPPEGIEGRSCLAFAVLP